jgi:hypothetical protein
MPETSGDFDSHIDLERSAAASTRSSKQQQQQQHSSPRRNEKGMMGRWFSRKTKLDEDKSTDGSEAEAHDEFPQDDRGPPPTLAPHAPNDFHPSTIQSKITEASNETSTIAVDSVPPTKKVNPAAIPPSARQSAFSGPPRFDWIDIVRCI